MVKRMCGLRTVLWMALVMGLSWFPVAWADLNDGLVAHYPFDGNANDASGNGNDGVVVGATLTIDRFNKASSAYNFDGQDDYIEIPNTDNMFDLVGAWSISTWVKSSVTGDQRSNPIVWKIGRNGLNEDTFYMAKSDNRFSVGLERASDGYDFSSASAEHTTNTFYHVVGTYDGKNLKVYVNGVLEKTSEIGFINAYVGPAPLRIGNILHSNHGKKGVFEGTIDDIRIYKRALSEDEIKALYEGVPDDGDCKHATYSLKNRTLTVPFVEMPVVDFLTGQPTGKVELWTISLRQVFGTTNRFRLLSKTIAQITEGSRSSCPATYAVETGTLSIPYLDIPTGVAIGNVKVEKDMKTFKATMTWDPMGRSFVVQEVKQLP
jgi:hypothetical protein